MNNLYMSIRQACRFAILSTLGHIFKPSPGIHILNGHMISRGYGSGTKRDYNRFVNLLTKLKKQCEFVNFETAVEMIYQNVKVDHPVVAFSFDDGFEDCYTCIAPALELFNVNAMFFINPNFASAAEKNDEEYINQFTEVTTLSPGKKPMTWAQIMDLKQRGFLIGAHTLDHSKIAACDESELRHQISDCRLVIEEKLKNSCEYFAWPYGRISDANAKAVDIACSTYKYVFSQSDHCHYFSFDGKVINRRHFESWWPISHINYFLSCKKS